MEIVRIGKKFIDVEFRSQSGKIVYLEMPFNEVWHCKGKITPIILLIVKVTFSSSGTIRMLDLNNEDEELKLYKRHKRYFNESLRVKLDVWISNRVNFPQDIREDMGLFLARYSLRFGVRIACNGCTKHIDRHRYRCLD